MRGVSEAVTHERRFGDAHGVSRPLCEKPSQPIALKLLEEPPSAHDMLTLDRVQQRIKAQERA